ncbi:ATP-dependent zinc metalloprotease FtsH [Gossypium australe]|uniref:ATP-dependent zinc metalloprotease FtsH n=1 Tax=Gossypium australe TaxID=47621 RepID=A0A5B6VC43_9ROSI|nr:ATP-dependent zinc metalloprotease FtsH [Gossypium australe]
MELSYLGVSQESSLMWLSIVFLLRDKSYQWWLIVKEGTQPDRLTWEYVKTTFQSKYVGASYVDARRHEFLNLT